MKRSKRADNIYKNVYKSDDPQKTTTEKATGNINDLLMSAMAHLGPKMDCTKDNEQDAIIQPKNCTITSTEDEQCDVVNSPMTQNSISPPPFSPLTPLVLNKGLSKTKQCDVVDSPMTQKTISLPPFSPLTLLFLEQCEDVGSPRTQKSIISPSLFSPLTPLLLQGSSELINDDEPRSSPLPPMTPETQKFIDYHCQEIPIEDDNCVISLVDAIENSNFDTLEDEYIGNSDDSVKDPDYVEEEYLDQDEYLDDDIDLDKEDELKKDKNLVSCNALKIFKKEKHLGKKYNTVSGKNKSMKRKSKYRKIRNDKYQVNENIKITAQDEEVKKTNYLERIKDLETGIYLNNKIKENIIISKNGNKKKDLHQVKEREVLKKGSVEHLDTDTVSEKSKDMENYKDLQKEGHLETDEDNQRTGNENFEEKLDDYQEKDRVTECETDLEDEKVETSEKDRKRDQEKAKHLKTIKEQEMKILKRIGNENFEEKLDDYQEKDRVTECETDCETDLEDEKVETSEKDRKRDQEKAKHLKTIKEQEIKILKRTGNENFEEKLDNYQEKDRVTECETDLEDEKVETSEKDRKRDQEKAKHLKTVRDQFLVDVTRNPTAYNIIQSSAELLHMLNRPSTRCLKRRVSENDVTIQPSKKFCRSSSTDGNLFSLQTSEDVGINVPKKKHVSDPSKWKRNVEKIKRLKGQSYKTLKGKVIAAKLFNEPKCVTLPKHKCDEKVPEEIRRKIFEEFRSLDTLDKQRHFINQHVSKSLKKRETTPGPSRKQYTYNYSFTVNCNKMAKVCRDFFLETLNITEGMVRGALKKLSPEGILLRDERGRKAPANKMSPKSRKFMEEHILSYPAMESHYCRKKSEYRYLDAQLNVKTMYKDYKKKCQKKEITAACIENYRKVFRSYKLKFHKPKKDLCKKCIAHKEIKADQPSCSSDDVYTQHLNRKDKAFSRRDSDKEAAQEDNKILAFNFDLESVLYTPKGAAGPFFYVRKLAVYNLTFYNLGNQDGDCYTWDETEGKRGSTEIATCVYKYINSKPGITHVRMMSDNCGGQQKNVGFCCMLLYLVENHPTIETIDHIYFETGHSHMECDSIHSKIEVKSKYTPVYTPDAWTHIIRMARTDPRPYNVITLLHDDFMNYNPSQIQLAPDLSRTAKQNPKKKQSKDLKDKKAEEQEEDKEKEKKSKLKFKDAVWMQYRKQNPNSVFLKGSYEDEDQFIEFKLKAKRGKSTQLVPQNVYTNRLPISNAKKRDLLKLCDDNQIPRVYHQYYQNLPSSEGIVDRLPEPDADEVYEEE